jgi:uncharacterized protein (TIRG00374 family)
MPYSNKKFNKYTIGKLLIAITLVAWLIKSGRLDLRQLISTSLSLSHLLGMLVLLMVILAQGLRWWWLLKIQDIDLSFSKIFRLFWIGQFFSIVLPGLAGGELMRGYYVARETPGARVASISTVILDRALGLYATLSLGVVSFLTMLITQTQMIASVHQLGVLNSVMFAGCTLFFLSLSFDSTRRIALKLLPGSLRARMGVALDAYHKHGHRLFICFILSLLANMAAMSTFRIAGQMTEAALTWNEVFLACPLVFIATTLPLSPGGIGIGETTASILFSSFGVKSGATIMMIVRLWFLILRVPGLLFFISYTRGTTTEHTADEANSL